MYGLDLLAALHLGTAVAYVAAFTTIVASLIALTQDDLKRLLAFSTIGQLSYIVLGAALLSPYGLMGGLVHIPMHAFGKITLFFCAGAVAQSKIALVIGNANYAATPLKNPRNDAEDVAKTLKPVIGMKPLQYLLPLFRRH